VLAKKALNPMPKKAPTRTKTGGQENGSLVDRAYATLRTRILDNVYPPGFQRLEQELAQDLGISRTPVREALIRLQQEGLVHVIPRHGMRVLPVSPNDMRDIYLILTALECLAAELAARRGLSAKELMPLIAAAKGMDQALKHDHLDEWAKADEEFHRYLVEVSGCPLLASTVARFTDRAHRARMFTLRLRPKPEKSTQEHLALVERIRAGDAAGASKANRAHRERGSAELLSLLEHFQLKQL
jgi:DNA-binding GntR family transcriptional regulator